MIGESKLWEQQLEQLPLFAREVLGALCNAELSELMRQAKKAADLVRDGKMFKTDAVEVLWAVCVERQLPVSYGPDLLQTIIADAFEQRGAT